MIKYMILIRVFLLATFISAVSKPELFSKAAPQKEDLDWLLMFPRP